MKSLTGSWYGIAFPTSRILFCLRLRKERRRVEEAYAQGLRKLAGKRLHDVSFDIGYAAVLRLNIRRSSLIACSIFRTPLKSIVTSTESLAQSHSILAQNIETDIEKPLRDYQTKNKEMRAMTTIQGNLASIAKDLETAQKRADKVKGGKSSTKIANATSDVEIATQQWESQAPYVFEQLQALDESRANHLRDVLTQLETHEADQVERSRNIAESSLNAILNLNTSEEISAFVAKTSGGRPPQTPRQKSHTVSGGALRPPTPARTHDDGASELSTVSAGAPKAAPSPCTSKILRFELCFADTYFNSSRTTIRTQEIRYNDQPVPSYLKASGSCRIPRKALETEPESAKTGNQHKRHADDSITTGFFIQLASTACTTPPQDKHHRSGSAAIARAAA